MKEDGPLVFVSYEHETARGYADEAKQTFEGRGYRTWVWHHDHPVRGYARDVIMDAIDDCDFFLYICTDKSDASTGQEFERRYAGECGRDPAILLAFNKAYISRLHRTGAIYNHVTGENFSEVCSTVAAELRKQLRVGAAMDEADQVGSRVATTDEEGEPLEQA